ncbi:hypothetical protein C9J21_01890 [Photobacterium phosphoreum]|uniref:outer membrane protein OmpK n=1 Tax=Photobacterium phosphoreum TaxID=659 RepID=UPI000D174B8C|nr:outer membrane protein OmpK [Photobacterium phosphoreum]PSW35237.1 hypothetical protein C9J21_01890 [Photobacterium phosphoreum]
MRKSLVALSVVAAATTFPAQAEYLYGFGDMSVNYLDWSNGTEERANGFKKDFWYLELEGGAGFTWGELYGFADLENLEKGSDKVSTSLKGSIAYKTGIAELRVYGQVYNTNSAGFTAQNNVLGLSYAFNGDGWFFNPFIGFHHTMTTAGDKSFGGMNGGMFGWSAGYNFNAFGEKFMISNWHESEFGRNDKYMIVAGEGDHVTANGAIAFWWNATENVTTGIQYRYAFNKLGNKGNQNAMIYTVKYNF